MRVQVRGSCPEKKISWMLLSASHGSGVVNSLLASQEEDEDEGEDACQVDLEDKPPPVMRHQWIRGSIDDSQVQRRRALGSFTLPNNPAGSLQPRTRGLGLTAHAPAWFLVLVALRGSLLL